MAGKNRDTTPSTEKVFLPFFFIEPSTSAMSTEEMIREAGEFIGSTLGCKITNFGADLKDGVTLCEFLNKLKPNSVSGFKVFIPPLPAMDSGQGRRGEGKGMKWIRLHAHAVH
jgi:hypothetical protein